MGGGRSYRIKQSVFVCNFGPRNSVITPQTISIEEDKVKKDDRERKRGSLETDNRKPANPGGHR